MANYNQRVEAILGNIKSKDQIPPTNAFQLKIITSVARSYSNAYHASLSKFGLVLNPVDPADMFDIGTVAGDPEVFTPATNAVKKQTLDFFLISHLRTHLKDLFQADSGQNEGATAGDAGKTAEEIRISKRTLAKANADTEIGADDVDDEV